MNEAEFWASVEKRADGCWIWKRAIGNNGYGAASFRGTTHQAHRLAWVLTHGVIPPGSGYHGTVVAHRCDTRACVNPDHLFLTDASGNQRDSLMKGRATAARLTPQQVLEVVSCIKGGMSARMIADKYEVTVPTIKAIANGRTWGHFTGITEPLKFAPRKIDRTKWQHADRRKIISMLESGKSFRRIAKECGTTHPTVKRVAREAGMKGMSPFKRMTAADRERIRNLNAIGRSQKQISELVGVSQASVSRTLTAGG